MNKHKAMSLSDWLSLVILSLLWGGSFFFVEIALRDLPIFTIVFLRVFLGALFLAIFIILSGRRFPKEKSLWQKLIVMGLLNNVIPFCLIVTGQRYISGGFASLLNGATPFFAVVTAHIFTRDEKISINKILGVLLGISGVSVLIGHEALRNGSNNLAGAIAVMGAAFSYSLAGVWGKSFKSEKIDPVVTAGCQLICSSSILLPLMLFADKPWELALPSLDVCLALLGIALFSTALAYILYFRILSSSGATNVLLVTFLVPVSAVLLGVFFLSEEFKTQYIYGMMAIGAGLIFIDGRLPERLKDGYYGKQ